MRPMLSHEEGLGELGRVSAGDSKGQDYGWGPQGGTGSEQSGERAGYG